MANLSDAYGTIKVEKVGKEFLQYLNEVQGPKSEAYYTLVDRDDLLNAEVKENGDLEFTFNTFGRWNYGSNIEGYIDGQWMKDKELEAYEKFLKALKRKDGLVTIEYTDSDSATDWLGKGTATLLFVDGEKQYYDDFNEESVTVVRFAELYGYSEIEALDYLYGDEVSAAYVKYVEQWKKDHEFIPGDSEPAGPSEWYDNDFDEEEIVSVPIKL